jgi:hypothetical protein
MRRRDRENDRDWHERRRIEIHRHNRVLGDLEIFLIGVGIGAIINR